MTTFTGLLTTGIANIEIGKLAQAAILKELRNAYPEMIFKVDSSGVTLGKLIPDGYEIGIKMHMNIMPKTDLPQPGLQTEEPSQ